MIDVAKGLDPSCYFLIVGNTRVGSTWMATNLHFLPGIRCRREIRWRLSYQGEDVEEHVYFDNGPISQSIRLACREWLQTGDVAFGSKFKLDPYGFVTPQAFKNLAAWLEPDVHVFLLTRSYFEIFESWKGIGIRHLANPEIAAAARDSQLVERMVAHHSSPVMTHSVVLTAKGVPLASPPFSPDTIYYPIEEAIEDLLVLFYNDVMAFSALHHAPRFEVVRYEDIRSEFLRIARLFNRNLTETQVAGILENPLTLKVEPDNARLVRPAAGLQAVSDYLVTEFRKIIDGENPHKVLQFDDAGRPIFSLPGLPSILASQPETEHLADGMTARASSLLDRLFKRTKEKVLTSQRPVYGPIHTTSLADASGCDRPEIAP